MAKAKDAGAVKVKILTPIATTNGTVKPGEYSGSSIECARMVHAGVAEVIEGESDLKAELEKVKLADSLINEKNALSAAETELKRAQDAKARADEAVQIASDKVKASSAAMAAAEKAKQDIADAA